MPSSPYSPWCHVAGVELLVGKKRAREIELILAKDGSGVGAAIISALAK